MYRWSPYYKSPYYYDYLTSPYNYRTRYGKYRYGTYPYEKYLNEKYLYGKYPYEKYLYGKYRYRLPYYYYYNSPYYYSGSKYPYYWYYYRPYYRRYFDDTYTDLNTRMDMFKSYLKSIPKNRSEMVNHLEIPDDWMKDRPYADVELESLSSVRSTSPQSFSGDEPNVRPASGLSTDSSISLSRALTDSEIDYDRYRRMRSRNLSDPFYEMNKILQAFPEEYLVKANSFQAPPKEPEPPKRERPLYNEDLHRRMKQFFADDSLRVFAPDDPALQDLEEALESIDMKALDLDTI